MLNRTFEWYIFFTQANLSSSLTIANCSFIQVNCSKTMFYDRTLGTVVIIYNSWIDIIEGGFYSSFHDSSAFPFIIDKLYLQTNALSTDVPKKIFEFESLDIINMENIEVLYLYIASVNCFFGATMANPVFFLNNNGFCGMIIIIYYVCSTNIFCWLHIKLLVFLIINSF